MKYYITGASGFIGAAICKYLEGRGDEVIKLRRDQWGYQFDKDSVVIHLAAYGNHYNQTDKDEVITANINMLHRLLETFSKSHAQGFVNISSSSVTLPVQTLYSASKLFGEHLVKSYNDDRMVNARPYSVYGPGEAAHRFIPTVIRHLQSGEVMQLDCNSVHDWKFIDDFVICLFEGYTEIGSGMQATNLDVVTALELIADRKLNYVPAVSKRIYDVRNWVCPVTTPGRSLFEGLKQTYESFTQ